MVRLRVKEFVTEHAPELTRYELGRRANRSNKFMDKIWNNPTETHFYFDKLETVAQALSAYLNRKVKMSELFEEE
ncbi:MAG: hypothetical protein ACRDIV_15630 [Ktedonobacteraceae bacterium]